MGRLDLNSEGLLLLTNDGELAHRLTKPRFHVPKEYLLEIDRPLAPEDESRIREGVYLHQLGIKTRSARVHCNDDTRQRVTIILSEGKKRQVRYTLGNLGYKVRRLERTAYGPLTLRRLRRGTCRPLTQSEIRDLKRLVGLESAKG
ncbi:MAG: rRNA pseudouridine synthase [Spirochaetes bacterium]|nr:rRNA pseudouridine synthase [Spirochaetota bacterium]